MLPKSLGGNKNEFRSSLLMMLSPYDGCPLHDSTLAALNIKYLYLYQFW